MKSRERSGATDSSALKMFAEEDLSVALRLPAVQFTFVLFL